MNINDELVTQMEDRMREFIMFLSHKTLELELEKST